MSIKISALPTVVAANIPDVAMFPIVVGGVTSSVNIGEFKKVGTRPYFPLAVGETGVTDFTYTYGDLRRYGLALDGVTDDYVKFNNVANTILPAIGGGTIFISGPMRIGTSMSIPRANTHIEFAEGIGMIKPDAAVTVQINCTFSRTLNQKFSTGGGAITFGYGKIQDVFPQWWGARPDLNNVDATTAIRAAIAAADSLAVSQPRVRVNLQSRGEWYINSTTPILISNPYIQIFGGDDYYSCSVRYEPGIAGTCFKFEGAHAGSPLYGVGIRGVTFLSGNASYKKVAVEAIDCSTFIFEAIFAPGWIGAKSTALMYSGRDFLRVSECSIYADRPFHLLQNTYAPALALDHPHFRDNEIVAKDAVEYGIFLDDNIGMANFTLDGRNAFAGGKGAVFYVPTTTPTTQLVVWISGFRYESPQTNGFYTIEWGSSAVQTLSFRMLGSNLGGTSGLTTNKGIKLRGVSSVQLSGIYTGGNVGLDCDNSVHNVHLDMFVLLDPTTASIMTGFKQIWAMNNSGGYALSQQSLWVNTLDSTDPFLIVGNKQSWTTITAPTNKNSGDEWYEAGGPMFAINGLQHAMSAMRSSADRGDASVTIVVGVDAPTQRFDTALTANRVVTLSTTNAVNGSYFKIVRHGLGAFTMDVGGLKTIPSGVAATVEVQYNGTSWMLVGYQPL